MLLVSCAEDGLRQPLEHNTEAPDAVSNVHIENLPGKARISYTLPGQQDLLYVKATYTLATGREMEVRASYYNSSLLVEGFSDEAEHEVTLYAVNRSEVASAPITVTIRPQESPIWEIFRSVSTRPAFGGIRVDADNPTREDVAILVMGKNEYDEWEIHQNSVYTATDSIAHTIRGMDTLDRPFAFVVRDRWLNYTDTLYTNIKPLYETTIPKSGYAGRNLPGDAPHHPSTAMTGMWDGEFINWSGLYMTQNAHPGPHVITFDVGQLAKLSRIVVWDYPEYYSSGGYGRTYYYLGNLKEFEIWGSNDPPTDGSFNNWHLLGRYNAVKPSGLPFGIQNDEDYQTANAGLSWEFDVDAPKVRYLRVRSTRNWGGTTYMAISEIQVYGDPR